MDNLKKYILGGAVVIAIGIYAVWNAYNSSQTPQPPAVSQNPARAGVTPVIPTSSAPTGNTTGNNPPINPVAPSSSAGSYKNGTYTGMVADAFYGPLQISATITRGRLSDVQFLQYPQDSRNSASINNRSNPVLRQEAIAAQSSNVNIVSGATQSSQAFEQSLASALAQAKI